MSACPLCRERKGKRACPAKGASICPACCGSKRRVEIDCPDDCAYLDGAHAGAWEGRETERRRDLRRVAPFIQELSEPQAQLFFMALVGLVAIRARRRELDDGLLLDAVVALKRTAETRSKGLVYEHPPEDARALGLMTELRGLFEARSEQDTPLHPSDADLLAVLGALEDGLRYTRGSAAEKTAFLDTATRLAGNLAGAPPTPAERPRLLID